MNDIDINVDELSDEEIESVLNTSAFQKALKYRRLAQGIEVLEENDAIYNQLVSTITSRHGQVRSEDSVREVLDLFVEEVKTYTEDLSAEDEDGNGLEDLFEEEG
jgi:hypothetical protein